MGNGVPRGTDHFRDGVDVCDSPSSSGKEKTDDATTKWGKSAKLTTDTNDSGDAGDGDGALIHGGTIPMEDASIFLPFLMPSRKWKDGK